MVYLIYSPCLSQWRTRPRINCGFNTTSALDRVFANTVPGAGVEARDNFTNQVDLDNFFSMVNATDETVVQTGDMCVETNGAFLKYMGTVSLISESHSGNFPPSDVQTAVVRDLVSLSDCIEGPGKKINYWGLRYIIISMSMQSVVLFSF